MNGIIDAYEFYFTNLITCQFDFNKRKQHSCLVCTDQLSDKNYQICSREKTEKFIIDCLEHLKIFGYSIKSTDIFINSVRDNGILSLNVKGYWKLKKHDIHEVFVVEHIITNEDLLNKDEQKYN